MAEDNADHGELKDVEEDSSSASENESERPAPTPSSSSPVPQPPTANNSATKAASALIIAANDKAGMEGIDRERINSILLRESGNSTFMQRQRKMDENTNRKIDEMKKRLQSKDSMASNNWRREIEHSTIEPLLQNFRRQRRPTSTCVVIDMDGFFISCHTMLNPNLAKIPACVGGIGMISTSNYVARKYGVRAAMPGYLGKALVDELSGGKESLTFVKSDFELYKRKSAETRAVLEEYDPNLKMYSLDEAYMDIGPYLEVQLLNQKGDLSHGDIQEQLLAKPNSIAEGQASAPEGKNEKYSSNQLPKKEIHELFPLCTIHDAAKALLHSIRKKVKDTTGLTCSAGLASNFLLAKIASDMNKPNGQYFVGPSEQQILGFVNPLSIRKVNGIGRVMEKTLRGVCGIDTVKDLYNKRAEVHYLFKQKSAEFLMRVSIGYAEGKRHESTEEEGGETDEALSRKGISHERTFSPTSSWSDMCTRLEGITLGLVQDVRERKLRPKTITLKVKLSNFDILTRATTRDVALFQSCNDRQSAQDLVDIVINLLKEAKREYESNGGGAKGPKTGNQSFSVRLLGVRCSNFQLEKDNQSSLNRYRTAGHLDNENEPPGLPLSHPKKRSPIVKNPYISPKPVSSIEKNLGNESRSNTKQPNRSLYTTSSQSVPRPESTNIPPTKISGAAQNTVYKQIQCPICQKSFPTNQHNNNNNNAEINAHIDACLNATTVKQLAKEETKCAEERTKKKKCRLADFFS